jgi:sarcosine oxidase
MPTTDVAVIGLGAMGSAAACQLARRGKRVVALERFRPGHERGSSHGTTRIIRLGYYEHPAYVPLLRRAYALWRELEAASRRPLLRITGIAEIGPPDGRLVTGTLAAARAHDLPHEVLAGPELMRRFPAFRIASDRVGVLQPDGGILAAERAVGVQLDLAAAAGAELRMGERAVAIEPRGESVRVVTERGTIDAGTVIVAAGPWVKKLLPDVPLPLRVTRQVMTWFEPGDVALFAPEKFPVFMIESERGMYYGFPHDEVGVKFAKHHHGDETVDPDACDRTLSPADEALIRPVVAECLPAANGRLVQAKICLYTVTPDGDFLLDSLPGAPQILVASPCSGHGFKFAPVIGEILADLATAGTTAHDISRFRLARFG